MARTLEGQVALVTGSTSGIGLGIARRLGEAGCTIVLNGFGEPRDIQVLCEEIGRGCGVEVVHDGADMRRPDAIAAMVDAAGERFGRLDILVNNAGIQHVAPIEDFPVERWDAIIAINLSAAFHAMRAAVPVMRRQGRGRIVSIASAHALVASPYKAAYVAAKHGLAGLTKTVALETAQDGITVNAVCPGYVLTPLVERQIPDTAKARGISEEEVRRDVLLAAQPTKEFVAIDDVAELVHFLAGDAAASITGTLLSMDGGWTAQ